MRILASGFGTYFVEPHLTVAGSLRCQESEVLTCSRQIAAQTSRGEVTFKTVETSLDYFRSYFLKAEISDFLSKVRRLAEHAFPSLSERAFQPHLSLVYGAHPSAETAGTLPQMTLPYTVSFDRLDVVRTQGPPESWNLAASFPLGAKIL